MTFFEIPKNFVNYLSIRGTMEYYYAFCKLSLIEIYLRQYRVEIMPCTILCHLERVD